MKIKKDIIILIILILFFGIYVFTKHSKKEPFQPTAKNYQVLIENIDNNLAESAPIKEINYFENSKDITNWFVRSDEKNGIIINQSKKYVSQGNYSMEVNWKTKGWGELVFVHFPEDWQNYNAFILDIFNPNVAEIEFEIKIGDRFDVSGFYYYANKFFMKTTLKEGLNTIDLKIKDMVEKINITSARKVIHLRFFDQDKVFYLDNMRLEK